MNKYFNKEPKPSLSNARIITFQDNPHTGRSNFKNVLMHTIGQAKESVTIATPYLHLPKELTNVIRYAHDCGVKVKLLLPGKADKKFAWHGSVHNSKEFVDYGIEVKLAKDTFMHSKYVIIDDALVLTGTSNFDFRALYLHNEVNSLIKSPKLVKELKTDFNKLWDKGIPVEKYPVKSIKEKTLQIIYQLAGPML